MGRIGRRTGCFWRTLLAIAGILFFSATLPSAAKAHEAHDGWSTKAAAALDLAFERKLLARNGVQLGAPTRSFSVDLTGTMAGYAWAMSSDRPLQVRQGDTVAITMRNHSMMAHPMHLHGHRFRVVGPRRPSRLGAWRDTLLLPPMAQATIAFEASNPGKWAFHCHHLYHMASGMMDTVACENVG